MIKKCLAVMIPALIILGSINIADASAPILTPEKGGIPNKIFNKGERPELTVATYNMGAARVSDLNRIANAIKTINTDVIVLDEVDVNTKRSGKINQVKELENLTGYYGVFGKTINFDGGQYGIAILSKAPILKNQTIKLPSGNDEQRVLLMAEVQPTGFPNPIIIENTHLSWSHQQPEIRMQQVQEIESIAIGDTPSNFDQIATTPQILMGDMNEDISGPAVKDLQNYFTLEYKHGMDLRTWPAANPALALDHIFTYKASHWKVVSMTIPNKSSQWRGIDWPATSDHIPVIAKLRLEEQ